MADAPSVETLRHIYETSKVIAVVGASMDPGKRAHIVPAYLREQGYRIIPVNPRYDELLGERCYASLEDIPEAVDVVDVFRPSDEAPAIARAAAAIGARVLWLQVGITSEEAARIAGEANMTFVSDMCMAVTHASHGFGPAPKADRSR
ncbi:MAG TPA: CoA-binding protein [Acidimicrobiia bacterium]